jgi:hypothetical protein
MANSDFFGNGFPCPDADGTQRLDHENDEALLRLKSPGS